MKCSPAIQQSFDRYCTAVIDRPADSVLVLDTAATYVLMFKTRCYAGPYNFVPSSYADAAQRACISGACQPRQRTLYTLRPAAKPNAGLEAIEQRAASSKLPPPVSAWPFAHLATSSAQRAVSFANGRYVVRTTHWTEPDIRSSLPDSWDHSEWWERVEEY